MASSDAVKEECLQPLQFAVKVEPEFHASTGRVNEPAVVEISSSSSDASRSHGDLETQAGEATSPLVTKRSSLSIHPIAGNARPPAKKPRVESLADAQTHRPKGTDASLPHDFLQPLQGTRQSSPCLQAAMPRASIVSRPAIQNTISKPFRQFWKAGDYESNKIGQRSTSGGMDHVRVHPKFLHSNATSHKWALGAVAELLDNALDEVIHGATFVQVDMIRNPKNGEPMLLIEDDGGGMNPGSMRHCMSLGYSVKSKIANTIGQYGNGFKTSTMRLGADVVVFSRCHDNKGLGPTESIGMLSYTFLRETGQEDIIVPMIDYEIQPFGLKKLIRSNLEDWNRNMESIKCWSPYATEAELMDQFKGMKKQGTRIVVFNLWEDDQGHLELDFDTDMYDIQLRGVNRDEKHISMAERFPNSRHYLTFQHSLRSYASILYLKLPPGFRMFLRGKEIKHHNLVDDLMFTEVWTYRPVASDVQTDTGQMKAVVTVGFVKDAKEHIDVQGFNVYHKNRLIKPFWRLWNSAASRGRGIIGVLEANFVEPAHDKQGFERTIVLARLENRLVEMQKTYWSKHCHKVGYVNLALKGKEGKAAEHQGTSSIVESHSAAVAPLSLAVAARPPTVEALPPANTGYASGAERTPRPVGVARSTQLQSQVHVAGQVHGAKEVVPQVLRQVPSQAVPVSLGFVGIHSQRHNVLTGTQGVPVNTSPAQMAGTQSQERVPFHKATRSLLPPPAISRVSMPQAEAVRRVAPLSGAQAMRAPQRLDTNDVSPNNRTFQNNASLSSAQELRVSQTVDRNQLSLTMQNMQNSFGNIDSLPSSAQTPSVYSASSSGGGKAQHPGLASLAQNSSVRSTCSTGDARSLTPGTVVETLRPAVGSSCTSPRDNFATQSFTTSPASGGVHGCAIEQPSSFGDHRIPSTQSFTITPCTGAVHSHAVQQSNSPINAVMQSLQDASTTSMQASEGSKSPAAGISVSGSIEQQVDEQSRQYVQVPPSAISGNVSTFQPIVQEGLEGSLQSETRVVEGTSSPIAANLSGSPSASPEAETQLPPEQSPQNASCPIGQESMEVSLQHQSHVVEGTPFPNVANLSGPPSASPEVETLLPLEEGPQSASSLIVHESFEGSLQHESHAVEGTPSPIGANLSVLSPASPEVVLAPSAHLPPSEQSPQKASRLTNKESMLGRKLLEDLGRSFAKKAASVTTNNGEQNKKPNGPEDTCPKSAECVKSIVRSVTNQELEVHLMEMEEEVKNLQQQLDTLKMERDSLRNQLLEERLRGQQSKQELQKKVEQTWAKVRELEAKTARLQLTQQATVA